MLVLNDGASIENFTSINIYSNYVFVIIFDSSVTGGPHGIERVQQNCDVMHNVYCVVSYIIRSTIYGLHKKIIAVTL